MGRYPYFPILKIFLFPDGHRFFQRIYRILTGSEGSSPVRRCSGYHYYGLSRQLFAAYM